MRRTPNTVPCVADSPELCCKDKDKFEELDTYADVVTAYIRYYRRGASILRRFFRKSASLEIAIHNAARCKLPNGKRHPHQRRIPATVLADAERRLKACMPAIDECETFADLYELVRERIGSIHGIGALTVYDVANHLGAYRGLEPESVYLHAGTTAGAKALGLDHLTESLDPANLPHAFQQLRPHEIEDCLCLYKGELETIGAE